MSGQWIKSQRSLENLRKYIDKQITSYSPKDINDFLRQAEQQKVMLIADTAGMEKITVLTHLSKTIKQDQPNHWVIRIDLNDHFASLKTYIESTSGNAVEFLAKNLLKLDTPLEQKLFKQSFEKTAL